MKNLEQKNNINDVFREALKDIRAEKIKLMNEFSEIPSNEIKDKLESADSPENFIDLIKEFQKAGANLNSVSSLTLKGKNWNVLPEEIALLTDLVSLDISNNKFSTLPKSIGNLDRLTYLYATNAGLEYLPKEIGDMDMLKDLVLDKNNLEEIPESIGNLGDSLGLLYVRENNLTALPKSIGNLTSLRKFFASNNRIKYLPDGISNWTSIDEIDLNHNDLQELPANFIKLHVNTLRLIGNVNLGNTEEKALDMLSKIQKMSEGENALLCFSHQNDDNSIIITEKTREAALKIAKGYRVFHWDKIQPYLLDPDLQIPDDINEELSFENYDYGEDTSGNNDFNEFELDLEETIYDTPESIKQTNSKKEEVKKKYRASLKNGSVFLNTSLIGETARSNVESNRMKKSDLMLNIAKAKEQITYIYDGLLEEINNRESNQKILTDIEYQQFRLSFLSLKEKFEDMSLSPINLNLPVDNRIDRQEKIESFSDELMPMHTNSLSTEDFLQKIKNNTSIPEEATKNKLKGKVVIHFVVEKNGYVSQIETDTKIGFGVSDEIVLSLKQILNESKKLNKPPFIPAKDSNGRVKRVKYVLNFDFPFE